MTFRRLGVLGCVIAIMMAVMAPVTCMAYTDKQLLSFGQFTYQVVSAKDYTLKVVGCTLEKGQTDVTVPAKVEDGKDVAFTVVEVGMGTGTTLPGQTFKWTDVRNVTLPETITDISSGAFNSAPLAHLNIPKSVISIEAFKYAYTLPVFDVDVANSYYSNDENGCLYNKNKTELIGVPSTIQPADGTYSIRDGVVKIDNGAFVNNQYIKKIVLPASVSDIVREWPTMTYRCGKLAAFEVASDNVTYTAEDGIIVSKVDKKTILCPTNKDFGTVGSYKLPNDIEIVGKWSFYNLYQLKSLDTNNATQIGENGIRLCRQLQEVTLGPAMRQFYTDSGAPISDCNISNYVVDPANPYFVSEDGVVFSKDKKILYMYPTMKTTPTNYDVPEGTETIVCSAFLNAKIQSVTIPASLKNLAQQAFRACGNLTTVTFNQDCKVTALAWWTFYNCTKLKQLVLPASLQIIYKQALENCTGLETIIVPDGSQLSSLDDYALSAVPNLKHFVFEGSCKLTDIKAQAFANLSKLESFEVPASVQTIGNNAFSGCASLKTVTFQPGSQITTLGDGAFADCGLEDVSIPESVTNIEKEAFRNCAVLKEVNISKYTTHISPEAFKGCAQLVRFDVDKDNPSYSSVKDMLCDKDKSTLVIFPPAKANQDVTLLPPSLTKIGDYAFYECGNLTNIVIPQKVREIGKRAFGLDTNLTSIAFLCDEKLDPANINTDSNDMSIDDGTNVADDMFNNITIYVRKNLVDAYKNDDYYKKFKAVKTSFTVQHDGCDDAEGTDEYLPLSDKGMMLLSTHAKVKTFVASDNVVDPSDGMQRAVNIIGDYAFENSDVEEVVLRSNVYSIGAMAFWTKTSVEDGVVKPVSTTIKDIVFCGDSPVDQLATVDFSMSDNFNEFNPEQKIYVKKSKLGLFQDKLAKYKNQISYKIPGISINSKYATFSREFDTDLSDYYATYGNANIAAFVTGELRKGNGDYGQPTNYHLHMTSVDEEGGAKGNPAYIPAGTGVLLKVLDKENTNPSAGNEGFYYTIGENDGTAWQVKGNVMHGVTVNEQTIQPTANGVIYVMQGGQFRKVTNTIKMPLHKAYLQLDDMPAGAKLSLVFDDSTTGVESIVDKTIGPKQVSEVYYNLQGMRVSKLSKGIYLNNGKKIIKK